jgi:glycosyltransferase involved in cell wall biosynthesis
MQNRKLQVIILTPGFPLDENDSTCIPFLQDYVLALKEIIGENNIKVISFQYPHRMWNYSWNNIHVYSAGGKNKTGLFKFLTWQRVIKQFKKVFKNNPSSIIHSFWLTEAAYIGQYLSKKYKCKHVSTIMGQDARPENKYQRKLNFNNIIVVSPNQKISELFFHATGLHPYAVIPHSIKKIMASQNDRDIDLLFVGSFIPLKQPHLFIKLATQIEIYLPNFKCVMAGDGELLESAHLKIKQSELINHVEFTGRIPRNEILQLMSRAKILVHTSEYEGYSTVITEALASGCHIICFDVGRLENSHKIIVCKDLIEMQNHVLNLLHQNLSYQSFQPHTSLDVAHAYFGIYKE